MIQAFGDVPFLLKPVTVSESYSYLREDKNQIYSQIIADLLFCKEYLPKSYEGKDVGRITTYAASSILAKIYLIRGDKDSAKIELKRIIDSERYSLDVIMMEKLMLKIMRICLPHLQKIVKSLFWRLNFCRA